MKWARIQLMSPIAMHQSGFLARFESEDEDNWLFVHSQLNLIKAHPQSHDEAVLNNLIYNI